MIPIVVTTPTAAARKSMASMTRSLAGVRRVSGSRDDGAVIRYGLLRACAGQDRRCADPSSKPGAGASSVEEERSAPESGLPRGDLLCCLVGRDRDIPDLGRGFCGVVEVAVDGRRQRRGGLRL